MRRLAKWLCLAAVMVLCLGAVQVASAASDPKNWMKYLPDSMSIAEINMPGTHDSGTAHMGIYAKFGAQCQTLDIKDQFPIGIRVFDLRLDSDPGSESAPSKLYMEMGMIVNHGGYNADLDSSVLSPNLTLGYCVDWAQEYLAAHESETIVFVVSAEGHHQELAEKNLRYLFQDYHHSRTKEPYDWDYSRVRCYLPDEEVPTLGEARGNLIVIQDNSGYRSFTSYEMRYKLEDHLDGNVYNKIKYMDLLEADAKKYDWKIDFYNTNVHKFIQEDYKNGEKPGNPHVKYVGLNITQVDDFGTAVAGLHPDDCANLLRHYLDTKYQNSMSFKAGYRYGWITMDFPEKFNDLVKRLINSNYMHATSEIKFRIPANCLTLPSLKLFRTLDGVKTEVKGRFTLNLTRDANGQSWYECAVYGQSLYAPNGKEYTYSWEASDPQNAFYYTCTDHTMEKFPTTVDVRVNNGLGGRDVSTFIQTPNNMEFTFLLNSQTMRYLNAGKIKITYSDREGDHQYTLNLHNVEISSDVASGIKATFVCPNWSAKTGDEYTYIVELIGLDPVVVIGKHYEEEHDNHVVKYATIDFSKLGPKDIPDIPETGDDTNLPLLAGMLALSLGMLSVLLRRRKAL